ncbi:MAG TPA: sugar ABC transporter substrate-binding protein [Cellulomonas sp.]
MNRTTRLVAPVAAVALAACALTACSSDGSDAAGGSTVTWSTWGTPDELTAFEEFNEEFMQRHPDITVDFQPVASYDDYQSKLTTQLTSGTAPDVFYVGDDSIAAMVSNGVLAPLSDRLSAAGSAISADDFSESIYQVAMADGEIYGLPNDVNPDALWYSKDALAAAGITQDPAELADADEWTTETFFEMTAAMQDAGLTGAAFWNYWATTASIMVSQGGTVYDDAGAYVANSDPTSVAALQEWADRFADGELAVADTLPTGGDADTLFVTGRLGFLVQGRYTVATIEGAGLDTEDFDVVRWPTADGTAAPAGVASSFLAINKDAEDADAAYTFFSEFLSADGQTLRLSDNGNALPSISGIDDIVTESGTPAHVASLIEMRDLGFTNFPTEAAVPGLSASISTDIMLPLYQGKTTAQEALDQTAALVAEKTGE